MPTVRVPSAGVLWALTALAARAVYSADVTVQWGDLIATNSVVPQCPGGFSALAVAGLAGACTGM